MKNTRTPSTTHVDTKFLQPPQSNSVSYLRSWSSGLARRKSNRGRMISTLWPRSWTHRASAVTTSPSPPTLAIGAISTAMWATYSGGLWAPPTTGSW